MLLHARAFIVTAGISAAVVAISPASACTQALAKLCGGARSASTGDCLLCAAGVHQNVLERVRCDDPASTAWCEGKEPVSAGLPTLAPCASATNGASDRWGLCAGGSPLSLRGSNYIRLGGSTVPGCTGYHTTFDAGVYNRTRYNTAFAAMQARGYNIVRVFLDERIGCGIAVAP